MTQAIEQVGANGNPPVVQEQPTIGMILAAAVDKGMNTDALEKLFQLYERDQDRAAEREFTAAMSKFKSKCPPIQRRTINGQFKVTKVDANGARYQDDRRYASLEDIESSIRTPLGECGLSYRWSDLKVENNVLTMTCVVSHAGGHSKASGVVLPVDSKAGCSEQQKYGAAMTYAQRYSLIQALGLTTCDEDTDGAADAGSDPDLIDDQQALRIEGMLSDTGADKAKFLAHFKISKIAEMQQHQFAAAVNLLTAKARRASEQKGGW